MASSNNQSARLEGKVCLVIGASAGIGRSIALKLAADGARLVVCASRSEKHEVDSVSTHQLICDTHGSGKAIFQPTDITNDAQVEACIAETVKRGGGRIDVLVNNAAVLTLGRAHELPVSVWDSAFAVNARGSFVAARATIIQFLTQEPEADGARGRIINIGSFASVKGTPFSAAYCASKGALLNLTKALALDYAADGILVNAVLPGYARTEMTRDFFDNDFILPRMEALTPMWNASPDGTCARGVANMVAFLASSDSAYMTGAAVSVDGGVTAQ